MSNPILDQAKAAYTAKINPKLMPAINKTVDAGKDLMFDKATFHMTQKAMAQTDPDALGQSFAGLAMLLRSHNPKVPPDIIIPAASFIMYAGLQFMEDGGAIKVDKPFLATAQKALGRKLLELFGATPDKIQQMLANKNGGAQPAAANASQPPAPPAAPPTGIIAQGAA